MLSNSDGNKSGPKTTDIKYDIGESNRELDDGEKMMAECLLFHEQHFLQNWPKNNKYRIYYTYLSNTD